MFTKQWELAKNALEGAGGFDDGGMLIQYPREGDEKLNKRKEVAYYVNHMRQSCQRFVDYLSRQAPSRSTKSELLKTIVDNADMKGNHLSQFMQDFALQAKARGSGLILVDMPQNIENSQSKQIKERSVPYFSSINPETIKDHQIDKFGNFEFIEFTGTYVIEGKTESVTYRYDKTSWSIKKGDKEVEGNTHDLGVCPVLAFTETGSFPALGAYYQIAEISKRIYNAQSELDELLRGQTFSLLTYQLPDGYDQKVVDNVGSTVGTNNMLIYQGAKPEFIAPASIPTEAYRKYIENLKEQIDVISNNVDLGAQQQSGTALALRFQNMNSNLLNFARRMEDFERRLFEVVGLWLKVTPDITISYPQDFNMIDKALEIEVLQNMQSLNAPKTYLREKMKQIIAADMVGIDAETEAEIFAELDEIEHERTT